MPCSSNGAPFEWPPNSDLDGLAAGMLQYNRLLITKLKDDPAAAELAGQVAADAQLGRMTGLRPAAEAELDKLLLSPRFGVQQLKPDGSYKVRAVDDCSRSGVNSCTQPAVKTYNEGVLQFGPPFGLAAL